MAFCRYCGAEVPENSVCSCQANAAVAAADSGNETKAFAESDLETKGNSGSTVSETATDILNNVTDTVKGMDKKQLAILGGIALLALIVIVMIFSALFGGSYKQPVQQYFKGIETANVNKYSGAFPKKMATGIKKDAKDNLKDVLSYFEDYYGNNVKFTVKFNSKEKLTNREIKSLQDSYRSSYKKTIKISEGYYVDFTVKIKGKDDKDDADMNFTVVKIKGEGWKIIDGNTYLYNMF